MKIFRYIGLSLIAVGLIQGCASLTVQTYDGLNTSQRLSNASVKIVPANGGSAVANGATDASGKLGLQLTDGTYDIICTKPGYFPYKKTINFKKDRDHAPISLNLIPECTIQGSLSISDGSIPGKAVVKIFTRVDNIKKGETESLGDGTFTLEKLEPGEYVIVAETYSHDFVGKKSVSIKSAATNVDIMMDRKEFTGQGIHIDPRITNPGISNIPSTQ